MLEVNLFALKCENAYKMNLICDKGSFIHIWKYSQTGSLYVHAK